MDTATDKKRSKAALSAEAGRRADRKAMTRLRRSSEAEDVSFLNITAMMDMMTILLVFMLKSLAASSSNVTFSEELALPTSETSDEIKESVTVTVTKSAVLVDGEPVVGVKRGAIDASEKVGGDANGLVISRVLEALKIRASHFKVIAKAKGEKFEGAMTIIADKSTPYRLLTEVMYTAGEAEYWRYRLVVLQKGK